MEDKKFKFSKNVEEPILDFFNEMNIYNLMCQMNEYGPEFHFMDGPPFPNSDSLHYGHLLVGFIKSCILNYKHMKGYKLKNMIGYDCHGLPIEMVVNKKLGINTKDDIHKLGIDKYNQECKNMINQFTGSWEKIYTRIGRFADYKNYYMTMDPQFMESVWWVFKTLHNKDLIYRGSKVMPYSIKCGTSLSNFEAGLNYKEVRDASIYLKFKIDSPNYDETSFIVWTTTPWTLPSNLALCVNPKLDYTLFSMKENGEKFIAFTECLNTIYPKPKKDKNWNPPYEIIKLVKGSELVGLKYVPPFNYFSIYNPEYKVLGDEFVKSDSGSGVVHMAPAFGEIDFEICLRENVVDRRNLDQYCPLTDEGLFTPIISDYQGMMVLDANISIINNLKERNLLIKKVLYSHSYPFCWRTDTPLIYKAVSSFFVDVTSIKDKMIENNKKINWVPEFIGQNRFHKWLENTKDWGVSRSRFFGTPIPVWVSDDGEEIVIVGSIDELIKYANLDYRPNDLHLESVSGITIPSKMGKGNLKLCGDVFDCWFESGSVPYAQYHYPFSSEINFDGEYLSHFICEGLDQTRGWFYTLLVLSTGLFDKVPFQNCICTGLILANDNKKLSKRLNNFESPMTLIDKYGSDTLRLYLIGSPASHGESIRFSDADIRDIGGKLYQFYNGFLFTEEHLIKFESDGYKFNAEKYKETDNVIDHWIISKIGTLCDKLTNLMDEYTIYKVPRLIFEFIENWVNWYIKFNRDRFKGKYCSKDEQHIALATLTYSLTQFCYLTAPFMPFLTEFIFQKLKPYYNKQSQSVHLVNYPNRDNYNYNPELENKMKILQDVAGAIRQMRSKTPNSESSKVPLKKIIIKSKNIEDIESIRELESYFINEINAIEVEYVHDNNYLKYTVDPNNSVLGKKYKKFAKIIKNEITKIDIHLLLDYDHKKNPIYMDCDGNKYLLRDDDFCLKQEINQQLNNHQICQLVNNILIIIDHEHDEKVIELYTIRLFIRAIQNMRKKSFLKPWNKIKIYYKNLKSTNDDLNQLENIVEKNRTDIEKQLFYEVYSLNQYQIKEKIIIEETVEILKNTVKIIITNFDFII